MRFIDKEINAGICRKCFKNFKKEGFDVIKIKKKEK